MKRLINKISYLGVKEGMPDKLADKFVLTNRAALILFLGNLQYYGLFSDYPQIFWPVVLGSVGQFIALGSNYFGNINISRFLVVMYPPMGSAALHIVLLPPGESPFLSLSFMGFAMLLIGWLLYDFEEKIRLAAGTIWAFICFMAPFIIGGLNTADQDFSRFTEGFDFYTSITVAFGASVFCMYLIQNIHKKEFSKNNLLLKEVESKSEEAEKKSQQLNQMISEIKSSQEKDRQRQWMSDNLSQITSIIRSEDSSSDMYDKLISQTVKALKANQGALYILEGKDEQALLDMKACYAYDRKKYIEKQIAIGQGLVGQCYLEKEYIYLTEIPQNYVSITSGLGEATPTALILVPLIYNEEVVGIIELASFNTFESYEIEFLQTMGASLANFIINIRMNEMTRKLLEESQQQAEQLQANEEELRQNMEEMNATQEEMQREINRYKQMIEEKDQMTTQTQNT